MKKTTRPHADAGPEMPYNPDAQLARSFGVGCGVLVLVFLCGWATIAFFWLR